MIKLLFRHPRILIFCLFLIIYSCIAVIYQNNVPVKGDEVHYLLLSESLIKDHDLKIGNNYDNKDYAKFFNGFLDKHSITNDHGIEYSIHDPGLAFLITPFYYSWGRLGVVIFLSLISSYLLVEIFLLSNYLTGNRKVSFMVTSSIGFNLPFIQYSYLIFTEIIGGLLILIVIRRILEKKLSFLTFSAISLLPWIHVRFLPLALILGSIESYLLLKNRGLSKFSIPILSIILFSISSYFAYLDLAYGSFMPTKRFELFSVSTKSGDILTNLINILIDRQYGLFVYSPIFIFIIPGFLIWMKRNIKQALFTFLISCIYLYPVLKFHEWNGGYNPPPARYIIPIIPLFIPSIVFYFDYFKDNFRRVLGSAMIMWGVIIFYVSVTLAPDYGFVFKDGQSKALFLIFSKIGIDLYNLMPVFYPQQSLNLKHFLGLFLILFFIVLISLRFKKNNWSIT